MLCGLSITCHGGAQPPPEPAAATYAVVASFVLLSPGDCVGAAGVPVNVGLAIGAPPIVVRSPLVGTTMPGRPAEDATPATEPDPAAGTNASGASGGGGAPNGGGGAGGGP